MALVTGGTLRIILWVVEAAVLLFQCASMKLPSVMGRRRGADEEEKSRSLILGVVALVCYLFAGVWYGKSKGWNTTDAVYFIVVTLTTVGYGDQTFSGSWLDQIFGGFYVFVGVAFIGVLVGEAIAELSDRAEKAAAKLRCERRASDEDASLGSALQGGIEATRVELRQQMQALKRKLRRSFLTVAAMVCFGAACISLIEGWSFSYSFLWASVTATTVGYGDIVPSQPRSKYFAMFYILLSFATVAQALGAIASIPKEARQAKERERVLLQFGDSLEAEELTALMSSEEINSMRVPARRDEKAVSRAEFMLWLLLKQKKLDFRADVKPCGEIFDQLDPDGSGELDEDDIELFKKMRAEEDEKGAGGIQNLST